jgi:hypothetical protein
MDVARLSSRPHLMVDQVALHRVKEPCYAGGLTRRGLALVIEEILPVKP